MIGFDPATDYGAAHATTYDSRVEATTCTDAAVEFLAAAAGGGPALELGVGTGRVALPLARRGLRVTGVDSSPHMLAQLRSKPDAEWVSVVEADMAVVELPERFALIYCIFSSLYWLTEQERQVECLMNAARHLAADGRLVVEIEPPDVSGYQHDRLVTVSSLEKGVVQLMAALHDPATQVVDMQYVAFGRQASLRPISIRYATPAELDLMARIAGLRLADRWGGWRKEPFTGRGNCVSVYRHG